MGLYRQFQTGMLHSLSLSPSFKYTYIRLKRSYKTLVKKDLIRINFLKSDEHFKLYIILLSSVY